MNTLEYIESGILEAYVLGMLSHQESLEVEGYRGDHSVIHTELLGIEEAVEVYATRYAKTPPAGMEASIMKAIRAIGSTPKTDASPVKPGPSANSFNWKLPLGILLLGLLGSLAFAFTNLQAKNKLTDQVEQQNTEMATQKSECDEVKTKNTSLEKQLLFLRNIDTQVIRMKGTDKTSEAFATVYWNNKNNEYYLDVNSLPSPEAGKQYQLWAIVDGEPKDLKVFDVAADNNQLKKVAFTENPQAFAVSLEKAGGSPVPTEVYAIGEIGG